MARRTKLMEPSPACDAESIADLVRQLASLTGEDSHDLFSDANATDDPIRYLEGLLAGASCEPESTLLALAEAESFDSQDDEWLASRGLSIVEKKVHVRSLNKASKRWETREDTIGFVIARELPDGGRGLFRGVQGSWSHQRDAIPFFERDDAVKAAVAFAVDL